MNFLKIILTTLIIGCINTVSSQDINTIPDRTPEQEAARQTEKLQQELQLTPEQTRKAHEINLKYARARKESNSRSESIQRLKDKETDLMRILDSKQRTNLQNKRYERSTFHSGENVVTNPRTQNAPNANSPSTEPRTDNTRSATRSTTEYPRSTTDRDNSRTTTRQNTENQRSTSERDNSKTTSPRTTIQNPPTRTSSSSQKQPSTNPQRR